MSTPSKIKLLVQEPESGSQHADARQLPKRQAVNLQIRSESPLWANCSSGQNARNEEKGWQFDLRGGFVGIFSMTAWSTDKRDDACG